MKQNPKKYLLWFNSDLQLQASDFPDCILMPNPDASALWGKGSLFSSDSVVVIVQCSDKERIQVIPAARVLKEKTDNVKILKVSTGSTLTIGDLDKARPLPDAFLEMSEEDLAGLADAKIYKELHPAQDFDEGVIFYGAIINGKDFLVSSTPEMFPLLECPSRDILLIQSHLSMSGFSQSAVLDYMSGCSEDSSSSVHKGIVEYLKTYIFFQNPENYDMLAVWVMGTYLYRAFRYFPYLHLNAEKGSGKTLLMELIAPIAFNGVLMAQPPASTVLKLIDQDAASLFMDEAEGLEEGKSRAGQLKAILKTGFARSGVYHNGSEMFRTYCPKCFAGINLLDDVLADRTIVVRILRKTDKDEIRQYRETPLVIKGQAGLRNKLYHFGLRFGPAIAMDYDSETTLYDTLPHLSNRAYDIWVPLFKIVNSFDEGNYKHQVFQSLDHLSQTDAKRRAIRDSEENETGSLISILTEVLPQLKPLDSVGGINYYDPDGLHLSLQRADLIPKSMKRKSLSRMLKRVFDIDCLPHGYMLSTKRMYAINMVDLEGYRKRYADVVVK